MATEFSERSIAVMKKIPKGKVVTYGQVAELAGKPGAARAIAWLLHSSTKKNAIPWHRVINSKGKISFDRLSRNFARQRRLLLLDGVEVDQYGEVDLQQYRWKKKARAASSPSLF